MNWLVRNWHLKLGALLLSTMLYAGLVFSSSFVEEEFPGVPIVATNQPANTYLLTQQMDSIDVTYRVTSESADQVTIDTFAASVDLTAYDLGLAGEPQVLPVDLRSLSDAVEILSWEPREATVALDRLGARSIRVEVDRGVVPPGLEIGIPGVSPQSVLAQGPESRLRLINRAVARVRIDPSGVDVSQQVDLEAVDVNGQRVEQVELTPNAVQVEIAVSKVETSKTVPVSAELTGSTGAGFRLRSVTVDPPIITLFGSPEVLASIVTVSTEPLDLGDATGTADRDGTLVLPPGTHLATETTDAVVVHLDIVADSGTRTVLVGVSCANVGAGLTCLPGTEQIALLLSGSVANLNALDPVAITPLLDMTGLPAGTYQIVPDVTLPAGVSLVGTLTAVSVTLTAGGP
jgi:YbbR domain-containing protein